MSEEKTRLDRVLEMIEKSQIIIAGTRIPAASKEETIAYLDGAIASVPETAFVKIGDRNVLERDILEEIKRRILTDLREWGE